MNTLNYNRSYCLSFIKGAAICILLIELYVLFFPYFNHCEAMPQPPQAELVYPGKVYHKTSNSTLMFPISVIGQYQTAILAGLNERVQFWLECFSENLTFLSSYLGLIPGVGKEMVQVNGEQSQKEGRQGKLSENDIIHIWFWFLIFIILISMISFWFTQRRVERFGIGLASLLAKAEGERLERFCSAARISARSDKSGEALRTTRRSGARSATERRGSPGAGFPGDPVEPLVSNLRFPLRVGHSLVVVADEIHHILPPRRVYEHGPIVMSGSLNCPHPLGGAG